MSEISEIKTSWLQLLLMLILSLAVFSTVCMTMGFFFHVGWSMFGG